MGAKLASCPGRHLTSLRPWAQLASVMIARRNFGMQLRQLSVKITYIKHICDPTADFRTIKTNLLMYSKPRLIRIFAQIG